VALLTSSASSIAGFTVMAFAPMPLFASYGLLTALMIFLVVSASLLVLPALLLFVTPQPGDGRARRGATPEQSPAEVRLKRSLPGGSDPPATACRRA
jgi:uncharacterized protein